MTFNVNDGSIVPVSMGSNTEIRNIHNLMNDIVELFPSPDKRECAGINMKTNEIFAANYDFSKSKSAYIFKTIVDPFIGKYSLMKVCSGVVKADDTIYDVDKENEEKISKLYILRGNKPEEVKELHAGDIGAIAKLTAVRTGDSLATKAAPIRYGKT